MIMVTTPQTFIISQECQKAAWQNGFRRTMGEDAGWARFSSTTAKGSIWLAGSADTGPWLLALDHVGVIAELGLSRQNITGPGAARFLFASLGELYAVLPRVYALAVSLPDGPLETFREAIKGMPITTEAERLTVQRIGQDIFRDRLLAYWGRRCPLTSITDTALMRASHIKPWAKCETDAERMDVHNGLLLSALWDAAFDKGLATFDDDGSPRFSPQMSAEARNALSWNAPIPLTDEHRKHLAWHRRYEFDENS